MTNNYKHNDIGELFRQKLEDHQVSVNNDWDEIEFRINKQKKNKATIWLWSVGTAAAATIAALLMIGIPVADRTPGVVVSQQVTEKEPETVNNEIISIATEQEITTTPQPNITIQTSSIALLEPEKTEEQSVIQTFNDSVKTTEQNEIFIAETENDDKTQIEENKPIVAQTVREIPESNNYIPKVRKERRVLLAAVFSTNSSNSENFNNRHTSSQAQLHYSTNTRSSFNEYATDLSGNIRSLRNINKNDYKNIRHLPPLSFGITVRSISKNVGIESGLVYTYLSSRFEWSDLSANYNATQNLHYVGIPVNMLVSLWSSNSNWQIYLSGGLTLEKGLRATYNQNIQSASQTSTTAVKKNAIKGVQLSANGALGANYRLSKGWGIYFEPRVGYSFDCNQPISARTEWPVHFGINLGLNYEL